MKGVLLVVLLASLGCSSSSFQIEAPPANDAAVAIDTGSVTPSADTAPLPDTLPTVDDRIDPIAVGRSWTYDVEVFGTYPGCASGSHVGKVNRAGTYQGKAAFEVQSFCPGFGASWYAVDGDVVDLYYKAWIRVVDAPVVEGHSWSNGAATVTWKAEPPVTTKAGTFDRCFRAEQAVGYPSYTIFCRGVGPVRWYVKDLAGNGYDAKLSAKSF